MGYHADKVLRCYNALHLAKKFGRELALLQLELDDIHRQRRMDS